MRATRDPSAGLQALCARPPVRTNNERPPSGHWRGRWVTHRRMPAVNMPNAIVETESGWVLPLAGRLVTRCLVDFAFTLEFWVAGADLMSIRIGVPFELVTPDARLRFDPESPTELGPALGLHQREVRRALASRDGTLEVVFTDETVLRVPAHPSYEAWEAHFGGGAMLACQPGGSVAVWSAVKSGTTPRLH